MIKIEVLSDEAQRRVPENGKFSRVFVTFTIPETKNETLLCIVPDSDESDDQRRLMVSVHNKNSDRFFSNYIAKGTKKDMLDYLANKDNQKTIIESAYSLSKANDDYYAQL